MVLEITTLVLVYTKYSLLYINSIWTNDFIPLLQKYNIKLKIKVTMRLYKQCYNDSCIMKDILDTTPSLTNIKRLNTCRLYLRITFFSEMCNIIGTALIKRSLTGDKTKIATSTLDYPN